MTELSSISAKKIKILKQNEDVGSSRDWLAGLDDLERRIAEILSRIFKISLRELALELGMRQDSLKLALKNLERRGLVVMESDGEIEGDGKPRKLDRTGKKTFIRYLGYRKSESERREMMYR